MQDLVGRGVLTGPIVNVSVKYMHGVFIAVNFCSAELLRALLLDCVVGSFCCFNELCHPNLSSEQRCVQE